MPKYSNVIVGSGESLVRIEAGVLNFAFYFLTGTPEGQCFELGHDDWVFSFVPVDERIYLYPPQIQTEEYGFTHHVTIRRADGALFLPQDAQRELDLLGDFLTFCRGFWVSTALTVGIAADGSVAMEELGTRKVSPKKVSSNWLDFHHGNSMSELFPRFVAKMTDPAWKDALRRALYWYVRADTNLVGPDGGCFLLQAALERLAWHLLVRDRQMVSERAFSGLSAAAQLRQLLSALKIPLDIPQSLSELARVAQTSGWSDGPQAFVEVRNRLVHPPRPSRQETPLPYFEAYTLAKWYVELVFLSACDYKGKYSNRTKIRRVVGEVENVPWV